MESSLTPYTRESLRPYYKTNPEPGLWKISNKQFKELNQCDPMSTILDLGVTVAALVTIATTVFVACYTRPILGAGGYYTLVTFLAGTSAVISVLFIDYCREGLKRRKADLARKEELNNYFNKPLDEHELKKEVNRALDPTKLPDDLKKLIYS